MQVQTHRLPTRWLTTVATLVIALPAGASTPRPQCRARPARTNPEETTAGTRAIRAGHGSAAAGNVQCLERP